MPASRKIFILFLTAFAVGLICFAYGYFVEPYRLVVNHYEISLSRPDDALAGMKIVSIADLHSGSNGIDAAKLKLIVERVNEQQPDVVFILGDFVLKERDRTRPLRERRLLMPLEEMSAAISGIKAKHGVFAVLGNHDGWHGDDLVTAAVKDAGYTVLRNEMAVIEHNGRKVRIIGSHDHMKYDSWKQFDADMREIVANNDPEGGIIFLQHSPDIIEWINTHKTFGEDLKLMLAGHTHGGQVRFPIVGAPLIVSSYGQKYAAGHIKAHKTDLFVTTGLGTSVFPIRFLVPPEISVLNIK